MARIGAEECAGRQANPPQPPFFKGGSSPPPQVGFCRIPLHSLVGSDMPAPIFRGGMFGCTRTAGRTVRKCAVASPL